MPNVKISALPAANAVTGAEVAPVVQDGVTAKVSLAAIMAGSGSGQRTGSYIISGGGVAWTSALSVLVAAATYVIQGTIYTSAQAALTVTTADPTNPRIDVIAFNATGPIVITGTAAATPARPDVDPATQLANTFFLIGAGVTVLPVTEELIYNEGTESTYSDSGATLDGVSTSNPYSLTKDTEGTACVAGNFFQYAKLSGSWTLSNYDSLVFYLRSKASWASAKNLTISWRATGVQQGGTVSIRSGTFGFDSTITGSYQVIIVPVNQFGVGATAVNQLRFTVAGGGASIGFYVDLITLQLGAVQPPALGGDFSTNTTTSVDGQVVVAQGTTGKLGRMFTGTGALVATAGVLSVAIATPFVAGFSYVGVPTASQLLGVFAAPAGITTLTFAAAIAGSSGKALVAATAQTDIDVRKNATTSANGTSVGTIRWAAAGTVPTFIAASGFTLAGGTDWLTFWAPASADATLASFAATLYCTRS